MTNAQPVTELDVRYSSDDATPTAWPAAVELLEQAELFWISTVRPDGRPHVTPLIAVWLDGAMYFSTGPEERKAKNLAQNAHCILTTGCNTMSDGLDLVIECNAVRMRDEATLQRVADAHVAKYGEGWRYTVHDGMFRHEGGDALVYEVAPRTAFGFGKGETFRQTRWRFRTE